MLRDFAAIGRWHPALPPCEIEGGPADRVGCVRVFPLAGDHRETLVSLDPLTVQREHDHAFLGGPHVPRLLEANKVTLD